MTVCNEEFGGDPIKGEVKDLIVDYSHVGQRRSITVREREGLSLP